MGSTNIRNFEKRRANGCETGCDTAAWTRGRKKPSFCIIAVLSGGDGLEFPGPVSGEIGGGGAVEGLFRGRWRRGFGHSKKRTHLSQGRTPNLSFHWVSGALRLPAWRRRVGGIAGVRSWSCFDSKVKTRSVVSEASICA